tara:strand:- start:3548 stop:3769 length:222 start_codon:yes stop_codon:yes gene_type:complete
MSKFNYQVDQERECDITKSSIAATEMCSIFSVLAHSRDDEAKFHELIKYGKQLQKGLYEMEVELKAQLRNAKK